MKKIVSGYDGSEGAKDALRLAADLRKATGAELVVVPVDEIEPYWGDLNLEQLNEKREDYFERMFAEAQEQLGDSDFKRAVGSGSAPAALEQIAETNQADLIVIGSSHRAGFAKVLPGTTGDRLLAGAPCAVAIAPKGYAESSDGEVRHVGIGFDAQHESSMALDAGIEFATQAAGDLRLVSVNPDPTQISAGHGGAITPDKYVGVLRDYFSEQLEAAAKKIPAGIGSSTVIREGNVAEQLAQEGEKLDLLVIGSRGYGPVRRVLIGSVAHDLMQSASCPLMVVPRSAEKATGKAESHWMAEVVL